tara:strand:+ start:778 stop:1377 length:600 start_codon:yes stop_codon:yes gene_type:complete
MSDNPLEGKKNLSDFIYVKKKSLDPIFCRDIIEKFRKDPHVNDDRTMGGTDLRYQRRKSLGISTLGDWESEDGVFFNKLSEEFKNFDLPIGNSEIKDGGYKITHQDNEGYYHWHHDAHWENNWSRVASFLWYLNTLKDGYTEFFNGFRIYPEVGKLVIFPATQVFFHRSTPTLTNKYICTGWMYQKSISSDTPIFNFDN